MKPIIGITVDNAPRRGTVERYESPVTYAQVVVQAGGVPMLLAQEVTMVDEYLKICHGFILSGGDDPDTTHFGQPLHPEITLVDPRRQTFESALIQALAGARHPVLGICLGMQMMALHAGGKLHQHIPDVMGDEAAAIHKSHEHEIRLTDPAHPILPRQGCVWSHHHQAVADPGAMRIIATAPDGTIEAIELPRTENTDDRPRFYLGVQWHPERTKSPEMGISLVQSLIHHAAGKG